MRWGLFARSSRVDPSHPSQPPVCHPTLSDFAPASTAAQEPTTTPGTRPRPSGVARGCLARELRTNTCLAASHRPCGAKGCPPQRLRGFAPTGRGPPPERRRRPAKPIRSPECGSRDASCTAENRSQQRLIESCNRRAAPPWPFATWSARHAGCVTYEEFGHRCGGADVAFGQHHGPKRMWRPLTTKPKERPTDIFSFAIAPCVA